MRGLLRGERIRLTALRDDDISSMEEWFSDASFMRHYDMVPAVPKTVKNLQDLLEYYATSGESHVFAIRPLHADQIIGLAGFDEIVWSNGTATVFIGLGPAEQRGKGIGTEALHLLLDFGFNELNLYKLQLCVIEYNEPAIRLYEGAGFVREGSFREFIFRDGKRYGLHQYGLLRREWDGGGTSH